MSGFKGIIQWQADRPIQSSTLLFDSSPPISSPQFTAMGSDITERPWGWVICNSSSPISEAIADQWETDGLDTASRLLGTCSAVIFDKDQQLCYALRDRFGQAPVCFHVSDSGLIFSSRLSDLAAIPELRGEPDTVMIADYLLSLGDAPALPEQTFFSGIKRLPPAHYMVLRPQGAPRLHRYWDLNVPQSVAEIDGDAAADRFYKLLKSATAGALIPDQKPGVFASGGLDSSALTVTTAQSGMTPDLLFLKSPVPENDETQWVTALADSGPYPVHTREPTGAFAECDDMLSVLAEPWGYENLHHDFILFREAAAHQCGQIISGYYGDVVVDATLDYLHALALDHDWEGLQKEAAKAEGIQGIPAESFLWRYASGVFEEMAHNGQWQRFHREAQDICTRFQLSVKPMYWHWWLRPLTPRPLRKLYRVVTGSQRPVWWELNRQINPDFAATIDADMRAAEMKSAWTSPMRSAEESHRNIITHASTALALEQMAALGQSQEVTPVFPFINNELIEFSLNLPRTIHCRDGWDRWVLRKAMDQELPESVCWRRGRTNYAATAQFELLAEATWIDTFIASWPEALSKFVNKDMFLSDWTWYREQTEISLESAAAGRRIFRTCLLGKWLERYG